MRHMATSLGAAYDPTGTHLQDPHAFYEEARRSAPVFFSEKIDAWIVTRWEDVHEVLRSPERFSSRRTLREIVDLAPEALAELGAGWPQTPLAITSDGAEHRARRAPLTKVLNAETAARLEPFARQRAEELVDAFIPGGHTDLIPSFTNPLPLSVLVQIMGIDESDVPLLDEGAQTLGDFFVVPVPAEQQAEWARTLVAYQKLIASYIAKRRATPGDDLISQMVQATAPGTEPLTFEQEADLVNNLVEMGMVGHVTTDAQIAVGVHALLERPNQWTLLCERPELIGNAVEEVLRYDSAAVALFRVADEDVTLGGQTIPAGADLAVMYTSASRDEKLTEDAGRLDVTRTPTRHMTFGFGRHFCPGAPVARMEIKVALEVLTRRLPSLRLAPGFTPDYNPNFNVRAMRRLDVEWDTDG